MANKRIQVVFDERAIEVLADLQRSTGKNAAETVRDALGFYNWARLHVESGKSIAVVDHDTQKVREFIMPFARVEAANGKR